MIVGYVFSRKDDKELPIVKDISSTSKLQEVKKLKLYNLLEKYLFYKDDLFL